MGFLMSYKSGRIGYGLSNDLDEAIEEAVYRCTEMSESATIVDRVTYNVLGEVEYRNGGYKYTKRD